MRFGAENDTLKILWSCAGFYSISFIKARSHKLSARGVNLNANYFGSKATQTSEDAARGDFDGQVSVDPDRAIEVKGDACFANVVSLRLL